MEAARENKMGVMPVKKLIVAMSLPMMVSMLVQALYNIVDSAFVAQISENALTAVTLAFPMQNLMIAVASGTGVGVNALLSRALGEKRFDRSDGAANSAILLAALSAIAFLVIGLTAAEPFLLTQTDNPEILRYGKDYLSIVCVFSFGLFFQIMFERLLQSTGQTLYSMFTQIAGAVTNIILDPIFIFGLLGMPRLEVMGAACATICGQSLAAILGLIFNLKKNKELHFSLGKVLRPHKGIIGRIYAVGVPSIMMMSIGSLMTYFMNVILMGFSKTAAAVFGVYFKLQSFFFMPVFGLNNGVIPVLAFNYGAKKPDRIKEALSFSLKLALTIMLIGMLIFEIFPDALLSLFNANANMLDIGRVALRITAVHFPIAAVCIVLISTFQAFSKSIYSLIVSILRQIAVLIPAAYLLSVITNDVNAVWWAFPIAEISSLLVTSVFFRKIKREIIDKL